MDDFINIFGGQIYAGIVIRIYAESTFHTLKECLSLFLFRAILLINIAALTAALTGIYYLFLYKRRNEVERFFRRIKRFRRVFTRYDKLDIVFAGFILFAMIFDSLVGTGSRRHRDC